MDSTLREASYKPDFRQNLGVYLLHLLNQRVNVISVVKQDGNLGNIDGFRLEIIDVECQHFNQSYIV